MAGNARVGSVVGRYFAMDRDKRWDRTQQAYDLIVEGQAPHRADTGVDAVKQAYGRDETDEFISPTLVGDEARIRDQDSVICFNFRPDRMRQLVRALAERGLRRRRPPRPCAGRAAGDHGLLRGGLVVPGGVPARAPAARRWRTCSPTAACASSTWPRPRSTPT